MIVIIDYGVGNLFSLQSSFSHIGADIVISKEREVIEQAEKLVLPGVGAFGDAAKKLRESGLGELIVRRAKAGVPLLGICLGMQLLFERSYEFGEHEGLGLLKGEIVPFDLPKEYKIPHIGWNRLLIKRRENRLLRHIQEGDYVYFVHSFYATGCEQAVIATTEYGIEATAAVEQGNIFGCQFHPEKSGDVGLQILRAFCESLD